MACARKADVIKAIEPSIPCFPLLVLCASNHCQKRRGGDPAFNTARRYPANLTVVDAKELKDP